MPNAAGTTAAVEITSPDLNQIATLRKQKRVSPVEVTRACLARIEALNPLLNAFITVTAESALLEAHQAEPELQRGVGRGPLHGVPVAIKDVFDTAGVRTTAASALFKDRIPQEDCSNKLASAPASATRIRCPFRSSTEVGLR